MNEAGASRPHPVQSSALPPPTGAIVTLDWLRARADAWDRLVAEAAAPNPFYARRIVVAHVEHDLAGPDLRFVAVHRGDELLALLPFRPRGARLALFRRAAAGWISPYVVTSTPLVTRHGSATAIDALLTTMATAGEGALWVLPLLALDSVVGAALQAAIVARQWPARTLSAFDRPVFDAHDAGAYAAHLGAGRRKDLQRRRRRLAERGSVEMHSFTDGAALSQAVDEFLTLEQKGWKGAAGTALACRENTAAYLRAVFADGAGPVACRADVLRLDGRPIAMSLAFVSGGTAYMFKTAYDETLRRYAPGVLLEDEIVRACQSGFAERLDSATMPGGVMDSLYPHRQRMGDLLFATDAAFGSERFAALAERETTCRRAIARLKTLYRRGHSAT
ncbi:MAG TPA: GNAT family N-acetyltransferase [Beijerinckiaceae bacterium]|nr:GNAT family N-acetyltransferase [Beijerinckiaceae bacterium]